MWHKFIHEVPNWRKLGWAGAFCALMGLVVSLTAGSSFDVAAALIAVGAALGLTIWSLPKFRRWDERRLKKPEGGFASTAALGIGFLGILAAFSATLWGFERLGWLNINQPKFSDRPLNPPVCLNGVPSLGMASPYPEVLETPIDEITVIGVCDFGRSYALNVEGLRVRGNYYPGVTKIELTPSIKLRPGEELEVVVVGRETDYYRQTNSVLYVIKRTLRSPAELIESLTGPTTPGFDRLDWERMGRVGLVFDDHGSVYGEGWTRSIYVHYDDEPQLGNIIRLSLEFCREIQGTIVDYMRGNYDPNHRRIFLSVPKEGGVVYIKAWQTEETLLTCSVQ